MLFEVKDWEPYLFLLSDIPIALLVEIDEAHIVAVNLTNFLAIRFDFTRHPVLSLHAVLAWLIPPLKSISLIGEGYLSSQLMTHVAHENIENVVTSIVKTNPLAILEDNFFKALCQ